ncbi:nitrate ABC transporter substrate-binding protein [Microbacterium sp.]|uniref:nitrate ABC transporter substrate-binding protein n=1 Tax=Microbacterium sp. TaxID=51671 RepID=UPI0039E3E1A7
MTLSPRLTAPAALALAAVLFTGCGAAADPTPTETGNASTPTAAATTTAEPTVAPTVDAAEVTCESILGDDLLAQFAAQGWTFKEAPLVVGGVTTDGIECTWANYDVPSGNLMIFGWGQLTEAEAEKAAQQLESEGWSREDAVDGFYITEDPTQALTTDAEGYGMTYQFGDGWVTVSDVKEGLLLIVRPGT